MWRGIELILKGRDPRDAWIFTQRICGVCTTVHAIASVRAVENALNLEVPLNAQYIRNMIVAAHGVHDHIVHFYHLAALDWVDIVSALKGDPAGAAKLGATLSDYKANSIPNIRSVRDKLQTFVDSGNLGVFASGYWGHPAMKLPPDVNLLAATHYIQALEVQRIANKIVTILGSKTPHIQNLAVGGVANAINPDSQSTLTLERLYAIKALIDELGDFVHNAMMNDVAAVGALYADWTQYGAGVTNYLSVPTCRSTPRARQFELPGGYIPAGDLSKFQAITSYQDAFFRDGVKEAVKHSWYEYSGAAAALHPYDGQTNPKYDDFHDDGKYSWIKAPTFLDKRAQVGPLANVLGMYAAGHEPTKRHLTKLVEVASKVAGAQIPLERAALDDRAHRGARRALRGAARSAAEPMAAAGRQYRQRRFPHVQSAGLPQGRSARLRLSRGAARRALALGRHQGRQDRQLPGGRALDLECRPARPERRARPLRSLADRYSGRRCQPAARGAAHRALVRPVHRLRSPHGRRRKAADRSSQGDVRARS